MHPALQPLKFLIGTWQSTSARGHFPNIKDFNYEEKIHFEDIGQPLLNFKSVSKIGERPMHLESGFLKINPATQRLSFLAAHNFGICTVEEGDVDGSTIRLESTEIIRSSAAKEPAVTKLRRTIKMLAADQLSIHTEMATTTCPELTSHLEVKYKKCE